MTSNDDGRRETREGVGVLGGGTQGALTSYEVGLTFLLLRFAEEAAEERNVTSEGLQRGLEFHESNDDMSLDEVNVEMPKLIGCLLHEWCANEKGCLEKLHDRLRRSARSESAIWEVLISGLRSVNSPDALFDVFRGLESIVCRDFVSPSQLHSSGAFGQMARRLILSFKQASFEAIVKLYDQVQNCLLQFDGRSERRLDGLDEVQEMRSEVQEQQEVKSTVSTAAAHASAAHADSARSLPHIHRHTPTSLSVSMSRLPYAVLKESVRQRTTDFHLVFLDYVNSAQNGFLDSADASLRSFHDKKVLGEDASLPVNAILALANLNLDMRQVDDALQALEDSIRAAQETSDSSCLCACLYLLSFILQITGSDAKGSQSSQQASQAMMHRCLERSEMLGLPLLQCLCCMNIARTLAKDAEKSASREGHGHGSHGSGAAISGATSSRMWGGARGSTGTLGSATQMAGFSGTAQVALAAQAAPLAACSAALLEALQGAPPDPHAQVSTIEAPVSVSGAFAHATMASLLSTCNGDTAFFKTRAKVLLCNAGISDVFGWRALKLNSCKHVMDFYKDSLTAEEHALALQLSDDNEVLEQLRRELPHAGHLWVNSVAKSATGRSLSVRTVPIFQSLVFQTGGALRAVRHEAAFDAKLSWGRAATDLRLSQGQLLAAYVSVHPCGTGEPPVLCQFFLSLAVIHKKAANPVDAMAAATRAVSVAAHAGLEKEKAEALLMMAQLKLQMQDPLAALHLAEKIETSAFGGHYGEVALLEAEALLDLLSKVCSRNQSTLLEATVERLEVAVKSLESSELSAPAEVRCAAEATQASLAQASTQASQTATARSSTAPRSDGLPQSAACATACALGHYWLARSYHQLKRTTQRDFHAQQFRIQTTGKITTEQRSPYPI